MLRAHNIRLIGIGLEELGYQEFLDGKFFDGDIYLDTKQEQYKALGYKRLNICEMIYVLFIHPKVREVANQGKKNKVGNNWAGDGFLTGGTLIIEKGGKGVLLSYKMKGIADHLENSKILEALNIDSNETVVPNTNTTAAIDTQPRRRNIQCDEDVCKL
ncbi:unnamed protein product [Allacma fusca]|uniref:Uncharacterized protein n=1 Tax=Allacma fusca TaxID=39272 RepID=A0A8J2KU40_9HEXA|nr:unnamed protein product [Allacma fusca]